MKRLLLSILILVCLLALPVTACASGGLSGRIEGSTMHVTWSAECAGECVLTVYQNGWPICVRDVSCANGSVDVSLGTVSGRYSLRLRTASGCYTADVSRPTKPPKEEQNPVGEDGQTGVENPVVTPTPTSAPTPVPEPTEVHTATPAPMATATAKPTSVATEVPTPTPTVRPTRTATATPAPIDGRTDLASQVVRLVNEEREKLGLGALRVDGELTRAACVRGREIVEKFSHTRPNGSAWSTVSASAFGENIAKGQRTAEKVMASWMTSQGHRENILRASYGSIGVCAVESNGVIHWVQLFGR